MDCTLHECGVCASESVVAFCDNCNFSICETCFQMHKKSTKLFQNHVAFLIENTKTITDSSTVGDDARDVSKESWGDIHTHKCATHTTENLVFFCTDHTETLCGRCVLSCHKVCKVVDLFEVNVDNEEVKACKSHLQNLAEVLKSTENKIGKHTSENNACKIEFLNDLQHLRTEVITWFDRLQSTLEQQCNETFETNAVRLTQVQTVCQAHIKRIQERQEFIDNLLTQNHVKKLYVLLKTVKQETEEIQLKLKLLNSEGMFNGYVFKRSSGIDNFLNTHLFEIGGLEEWCSGSDEILDDALSSLTVLRLGAPAEQSLSEFLPQNCDTEDSGKGREEDVLHADSENNKPMAATQSGLGTTHMGDKTDDAGVARSTGAGGVSRPKEEAHTRNKLQNVMPPVQTVSMPMPCPGLPPQPLMPHPGHMTGPAPRVPYGHVLAPRGPILQNRLSMPQAVSVMGPQVVHAAPGAVFATPTGSIHVPTTAVLAGAQQLITATGMAPPGTMIFAAPPPFTVPVPQFSMNVPAPQTPPETVRGGTTYYVSTTASGPTTGTTFYSPEMQLSNSIRVPTRKPKAPLPIVNPEDVKKEKGKPETQESQVKEPELSNQINNQMSESVEFVEEKPLSEDPLDVNEADEDVANAEADIDQNDEETTEKDNEISYEDNTDSEEFYESTDQVEINGDNNEELGAMQAVENDTVEEVDIQNESFDSLGEETDLDRLNEMESIIDISKEDIDIFKEVHEETEDDDQIANGDTEEVTDTKEPRSV